MAGQKYGEIRYNIDFEVNNQSLQSLKKSLQDIMNMSTTQYQLISPNASKEFAKAGLELKHIKENASQVQQILTKTFNEKLNTSNITQLRNEINKIGFDNIYESWSKLGINGTKAFNQLTASILSGNTQLKQTHKILDSIATSFKNTIKWGISSAVWNNLTGSIQKAWTYTKNLDSALNDIRIVSGQSAAQMEKFAIQANKAAQALGSSTLDYAKASLIYFQQGLGTEEANARAEVTVKMANVLGASAKEVSDYMTAIWNNFDNGSKSLEYFADVITALGASTAASSEEIATGLEKFAAVANTVGLSYEYATAALATVVAQTRQSADTVGTAFKTIFARIQDLELGKTLDDGTTLGKYAEALQKVGINIKDQQNQLKDMNTILDEMGKKWTTLTKDQQVALAQNVAGTRQYTQLIALLDNWDDVAKNIKTAGNATGTLQKQQDIYLESTEAHLTKLSTATERLMSSFADKKGINSLIDGLTNLVTFMSNFIESIGGGKNALMVLGSVGMQVFDTQIARSIGVTLNNLKASREAAQSFAKDLETLKMVQNSKAAQKDAGVKAQVEAATGLIPLRDIMTTEQIEESSGVVHEIGEVAHLKQEWEETGKQVTHYLELLNSDNKDFGRNPETGEKGYITDVDAHNSQEQLLLIENLLTEVGDTYKDINDDIVSMGVKTQEDLSTNIDLYTQNFQEKADLIKGLLDEVKKDSGKFFNAQKFEDLSNRATNLTKKGSWLKDYDKTEGLDIRVTPNTKQRLKEFGNILDSILKEFAAKSEKVNDYIDKEFNSSISHSEELKNKATQLNNKLELLKNTYQQINEIKGFVNMVAGIGQVASAISSLTNLTNILKNDSLSTSEKILQVITNVSMSIPLLVNGFQTFIKSGKDIIGILQKQILLTLQKTAADGEEAAATLAQVTAGEIEAKTEEEIIALKAAEQAGIVASTNLKKIEAAGNVTLSMTFKTLGASILTALSSLLPFIVAGGALVAIISNIVKAYNADADAAKEAAEAQKHAVNVAEEAKQAYQDLSTAFEKYDEGVEAFKKLTVGTQEYQEALDKANESAMDLIKSNNALAKYAKRDNNGLITFGDEKNQKQILKMSEAAMYQTEATADVARINSNQASLKSERTNFLRNNGMAGITVAPKDMVSDIQLQEIIRLINNSNGNFIDEDLQKIESLTSDQISVLLEHKDALITLAEKTDTLNKTNNLLTSEALKNSLMINEQTEPWFSKKSTAEQNAIAAIYGSQYGEVNRLAAKKQAEDKWDHDKAFGGGNEDEVHTEYAKRMGYTLAKDNSGDTATFLNNRTGEEITVEDDVQRAYLKNDDMQREMAIYDTDYLNDVVNTLDKLNNDKLIALGNKYGADFKTAIYNAIASDDKKVDLTDLFTDLSPDEVENLKNEMSPNKWKEILGLSDDEIKELGFISADEFAKNFDKALNEYQWSAKDAVQKALLSDSDYENIGLKKDEVAGYSEYLMEVANGAEDASDKMNDLANEMQYNAKAATITAKSIMRMNNGIEKLADGQKDWLDVLKKSSLESEEYYDALNKMRDAFGDLLDISKDTQKYFDGDFFKKNSKLIEQAAKGSASAIDQLRKEASKSILISIAMDNKLDNNLINNLKTELDNLQKMAEPIVVGTELNIDQLEAGEGQFIDACNRIISESKMTAEQATAFFESIGFEPTFETTEKTVTSKKPITKTVTEDSTEIVKHGDESVVLPATRTWSYIDGYTDVEETIQIPAMSSDGNAPTIKTLTKKGTGASNNYSSKNKGGGGPGKSSKSGGGSNSNKKHVNDEFDRYHQINTQITKVDNSLQKLQSQQKKLTGDNLIQNLTKQWQLLNTQVDNYNKKLDIAYGEQDELYKKLTSKGFKFNSDGTIANYMGALKAAEDKYNAKIDQYNSLSSANKKKWDKNETLDKAKEEYDNIKKWADRYDELISDFIPGLQQDIQDSLDKQIELNVQKFNLKLTVTLDMNQATRDWNEWKKRIIDGIDEDDIYGNANARLQDFSTYYSENGRGDIQAQTEQVKSILTELREMDENGWSDIYHDDRAQALEELKEKYTALMESMTDAAQIEKDLYQAVLDEMDAVREKFDEQVESYEFLRDIINHDLKVIQMVYGEDAYGAMSKFYDKQQQTYNEQLDFHKQEMDLWYARMQAAEEGSKEWEKARNNWKDAVENYNQTLEEGLENAKNKFQNALNDIFQNLNNQVTSGKGLDFVNEEWELVNKNANKYLDTINATYGIRELEKKYLDSINKTDNVKAQQKLKKVMDEQLTNLRQKDKLTQYDLDRANKLYEIELARMALEDARQNKSQMRLRRDSQGNYSYQYVANQDELQKAQDQVDQLTNSLYNFDKERYNAVLGEVYTIWSEYQQKMAEASLINDPELRAEKQRLIQEQYNQLMMQTEEDYQVSKYNLEESFFKDWTNLNDMSLEDFQNLSDNEKDIIMTEMVPTWKNGISEMAEVFYGENGFARVTQDSWKAIKDAEKEYDDDLKTLETTAEQTYDAIKNGLDENIPKSEELIKNNNDLITVYDEELTRVENVYRAVGDLITQYREAEQAAKDAAEAAYKYENKEYNKQIDEIGDQGNSEPEPEKQPEPTPTPQPEPTLPPVDNTPQTGTGNGVPEIGDDVTVKKSATKFSSKSGGAKMWYKVPGNKFYIKAVSGSEIKIGDPHGPNYTDTGITGWVNKKDLEGYDTGGYTGAWDNSGRLAMLHQKELILNQTDTKNMLNAVSVMRGLTYSLGSSILAKLANASATNYSNTGEGGGILEQDVHIEATFPNVRNAVEIEQALNNLVNVASQRIMEKR